MQLANHHRNRSDDLIHSAIEISHAIVFANLERAQEAKVDHEEEGQKLKAILNGLAQSDRVRAELEDCYGLKEESERDPAEEDGKRAERRRCMLERQRRQQVAHEARDLEPVLNGAEHLETVVVGLKDLLEHVDQKQEKEIALVEPEKRRARLVEHRERVGQWPEVICLFETRVLVIAPRP